MKKIAINHGLILGLALALVASILYYSNTETFLLYRSFFQFIAVIAVFYKAATSIRAHEEGFASFGDLFKNLFIVGAIGFALCTTFEFIQFNVIDVTLGDQLKELTMEKLEETSAFIGGDTVDNMIELIEDEDMNISMRTSFMNYLTRILFPGAFLSLIFGLIFKKNAPPIA